MSLNELLYGWFVLMFIGMLMVEYRLSKIQRLLEKDKK